MEKKIKLLAILLGAQVALGLGANVIGSSLSTGVEEGEAFIALATDKVDRLIVEGPEEQKVELVKVDGAWRLPQSGDFPADRAKVDQLLTRLRELKVGRPVATTEGAFERFKLTPKGFERRITLVAGGDRTVFYLGNSAGLNQAYARVEDQNKAYAVKLATYDVGIHDEHWQDKGVVSVPKDEIEAIELGNLRIERAASDGEAQGAWQVKGASAKEEVSAAGAERLATALSELRFGEVLGREKKKDYGIDKPVLSLTVVRKGGEKVDYRLGKTASGHEYTLKASSRPEYFRMPTYLAQPLLDAAKREVLVTTASEKKSDDASG